MKITLHQFYFDSIVLARKTGWRYGQAMFNHLLEVHPILAETIRGTSLDPFHKTSPLEMDDFFRHIETQWSNIII